MTFKVTYRNMKGELREEAVEAESRAACVAAVRARGISPVSVTEGSGNGGAMKRRGIVSPNGGTIWRAAILMVVVLIGVGVAWWWYAARPRNAQPTSDRVRKAPTPQKASVVKRTASQQAEPVQTAAVHVAEAPVVVPSGHVIKARSPRSGRVMTLADGTVVTNTPRMFFKRDFERALHVALMPNGMGGALLRQVRTRYTDAQILAMLKERVPAEASDDETTVAVKAKVQSFKDEMLRVINQGASVPEVLDGMTKRKVTDGLLRAKAFKIRTEALRSQDPDVAREGIQAANAVLEENGLRQMEIPQKLKVDETKTDGETRVPAVKEKISEDQNEGDNQ